MPPDDSTARAMSTPSPATGRCTIRGWLSEDDQGDGDEGVVVVIGRHRTRQERVTDEAGRSVLYGAWLADVRFEIRQAKSSPTEQQSEHRG